ncbi:hypothetical protein MOMA_01870 [Moraxella macacae 0408225]|uniref:EamA domain-containing protein n=1 Tax=Moraxella macacae 0408225 TaxID=1230338 RepID=L2F8A6_9GAMM|nr:EamA family transporter [Moraxella macacae]ELA09115.1 hypothetical protein MOMA_01870 [Moraxella macacae 0408225]
MWYMILALLIWASSFTAGKYAYTAFDPVLTVQFRLLIAGCIALPVFVKHYRQIDKALSKKLWLLALLNFPIALMLQFVGLKYTSASSAVTIVGAEPLFVMLIGALFFGQKNHWYDWVLGGLAFFGIVLLVTGGSLDGTVSVFGSLLLILAGLAFVFSMFWGKDVMQQIDAKIYTAMILVLGALVCIPFSLVFTESWAVFLQPVNPLAFGAVLYLGVACSWLAYWLFNKGLQSTPTKMSAMLIVLEPVFGVLFAMLILGEKLQWLSAIGVVMVIGSTIGSAILHNKQTKPV